MHHPAAALAGAGTQLEHEVGLLDRGEIVLDHQHRVAAVAQPAQQGQQPVGVPGVETDRGLVQHVERVHQLRAEGVGEGDPLRLAAGERPGLAVEREVAQSHVAQEAEPGVELVEDEVGDFALERRQLQGAEPGVDRIDRAAGEIGDGRVLDPHRERVGIEPGAAALAAGLGELVLPQEYPDVLLVPLLLEVLEEREDPHVASLAAVEQIPAVRGLELVPRPGGIGAEAARVLQQDPAPRLVAGLGPGIDRPVGQAAPGIGHHQRLVVFQHGAEAVAGRAGAAGIVEGEERRGDGRRRRIAGTAGRRAAEPEAPVLQQGKGDPFALLKRGRHRFRDPAERFGRGGEPVHDHQQLARLGEIEGLRQLVEVMGDAIRHHPHEPEGPEVLHHRRVGQPRDRGQGKGDLDPARPGGHDLVGRGLRGVGPNRRPAGAAEAPPDPGPEEPEVVVDLGRGPDGGAAGHDRIPLLDRHRGRDPLEPIDQRLRHPLEELLGVGGQRLDVPPLPLGVERVERERALPGAGGAGHHGESPVRQVYGDALQVVLASVDDADD